MCNTHSHLLCEQPKFLCDLGNTKEPQGEK